ncbi:MAG TPA: YkgJ family cysteine cluster protein [Candidatus Hydrogenedentes bacterium]|nr:YkgJ family cysteine cluster protein [Candidatus Hydrogenedentota bacterium]HNT89383.1 YkgJ family cysteine cluster protein [Candidatus Hydrogenedentota bacterium]
MGKEFVRFQCHHCNHCCTEVVCLPTPWDVLRIVRGTGADPFRFLEFLRPDEICEVEADDPTWLDVNGAKYIMALRRTADGCFFLDKATRFCAVYKHRPILCRLYPFVIEENARGEFLGFSLHKDVGCPRHRDGRVPVAPLHALYLDDQGHQAEYQALVRAFNEVRQPGKRPEDFIETFLETDAVARACLQRAGRNARPA